MTKIGYNYKKIVYNWICVTIIILFCVRATTLRENLNVQKAAVTLIQIREELYK
jgi:hypothetical protein